jgi:hypothetical protein
MSFETAELSDITSMAVIAGHLENDPWINCIIDVKENDLDFIDDIISRDDVAEFNKLIQTKSIEPYFFKRHIKIPLDNAVDVIRIEPFYLVKDKKVIYK